MMMKKTLLFALAFVALSLQPVWAQATIDSTTLSAAVQPTATQVVLASVTCTGCTFGPGITLYVDTEQMRVAPTYVSGTTVPVIRTKAAGHANAAVVFVGPNNRFGQSDPPVGLCNKFVQNNNGFHPWINLTTGAEWICDNGVNQFGTAVWRVLYPYAIGTQAASR
jgi:hypothetical protein